MVLPRTIEEEFLATPFIPDHKLMVTFAVSKFDNVWQMSRKKKTIKQLVDDHIKNEKDEEGDIIEDKFVDIAKEDCKKIREAFAHYDVTDTGEKEKDLYTMENNPT